LIPRERQDLRIHGLLGMATSNAFLRHIRIRHAHFRRFASGGVTYVRFSAERFRKQSGSLRQRDYG
jgi:hypothetical protein